MPRSVLRILVGQFLGKVGTSDIFFFQLDVVNIFYS